MRLSNFLQEIYIPSRLELSAGTIRQIQVAITLFSRWLGRSASLTDLDENTIRQFLTAYRVDRAAATTNSRRRDLLALWQCAYDEEMFDRPPRRKRIRRAKESPRIPEAWTSGEVGRILEAIADEPGEVSGWPASIWWRSLILVLYDTGERRGAVMAAGPQDLSLAGCWIVFRHTKTGRPRWCPLHADTIVACREIFDPGRERIWPWAFSDCWLSKSFKRILDRAKVAHGWKRGGVFHKLRRTTGSLVEQAGGDGAKHIGNTRAVFLRHYCDPRFFSSQLDRLPRPTF